MVVGADAASRYSPRSERGTIFRRDGSESESPPPHVSHRSGRGVTHPSAPTLDVPHPLHVTTASKKHLKNKKNSKKKKPNLTLHLTLMLTFKRVETFSKHYITI